MNDTTPLDTTPAPTPRRRFSARPLLIGAAAGVVVLGLGIGGFAVADAIDDRGDDDRVVITSGETPVPVPNDDTTNGSTPSPGSSDDAFDDNGGRNVSEEDYAAVSAAALDAVGGGTVTELKRDDDPGKAWEVEILLANGDEAEVELDAELNVLRVDLDRHDD
jgi:hypothetical protein